MWYKQWGEKKCIALSRASVMKHTKLVYVGTGTEWLPPLPFTYVSSWGLKKVAWFHVFPVHHPYWPRLVLLLPWFWLATFLALNLPIQPRNIVILIGSVNIKSNPSTLKTDTACFFETPVFTYKTAWYHNTKGHGMNNLRCRNFKAYTVPTYSMTLSSKSFQKFRQLKILGAKRVTWMPVQYLRPTNIKTHCANSVACATWKPELVHPGINTCVVVRNSLSLSLSHTHTHTHTHMCENVRRGRDQILGLKTLQILWSPS
jgi:hypothetical protein